MQARQRPGYHNLVLSVNHLVSENILILQFRELLDYSRKHRRLWPNVGQIGSRISSQHASCFVRHYPPRIVVLGTCSSNARLHVNRNICEN